MPETHRYLQKLLARFQSNKDNVAEERAHRLNASPAREDVIQAFRLILGREPENEEVIKAHLRASSVSELRTIFLQSQEFAGKYRTMQPEVAAHPNLNRARRAVVFIHLQKTGGTSLRELIGRQFLPERRCPIFEDKLHVLTLSELGRYDFFAGHFDISCIGFIPREEIQTLAMFREPHARLISFYRFLRSHPTGDEFAHDQLIPLANTLTAEEFFERSELRALPATNNHYLFALGRSFTWFDQNRESLSKGTLSAVLPDAMSQIHALTTLGITERFYESAHFICRILGMKAPDAIEALHVTDNFTATDARFRRVEAVEMTRRLADGMSDLVEYDKILYDYAVSEFDRRQGQLSTVNGRITTDAGSPNSVQTP